MQSMTTEDRIYRLNYLSGVRIGKEIEGLENWGKERVEKALTILEDEALLDAECERQLRPLLATAPGPATLPLRLNMTRDRDGLNRPIYTPLPEGITSATHCESCFTCGYVVQYARGRCPTCGIPSMTDICIRQALESCSRPYIAFSGGKDSLVVMHMVSQIDDSVPIVYCDDELLYPEHVAYMDAAKDFYAGRLRIVQGGGLHRDWFRPWKTGVPWWRPPHPSMEFLPWVAERNVTPGELATRLGYDGVFLGLRRAESLRRAGILATANGLERLNGVWYANPLIEWSDYDVWAYIKKHNLPYCPVYNRLSEIGVSTHHQRLGPLALTPGEYLWKGWPSLYASLIRRYGLMWTRPASRRKPKGIATMDWLEILDAIR